MKKYANHKLRWKGGILIALISTILLYTLATVYAEEEADVSVEWQPEASEARTGETVAIRLSSYINTETAESAEVKIALTEEEASMLGELPEGLALENAEGGGLCLAFSLTQEQPSLDVELTASVPAKTSASASIEVTEDDIQIEAVGKAVDSSEAEEEPEVTEQPETEEEPEVTEQPETEEEPEATGQPETEEEPEVTEPRELIQEKKGGTLNFTASFGWTLEAVGKGSVTLETVLNGSEDGTESEALLGDAGFDVVLRSQNREDTGTVYTQDQSLRLTLALPEGITLPEGELTFDAQTQTLMLDGSALIQLSGLPEGMTLTECARTEEGLSFTLERSAAYDSSTGQEPEELADLELTLTVSGSVLAADAQTSAGASEIRLDAELESVPLAGTADSRTASAACSISADGEKTENAEEAVPEEESLPEVQSLGDTVEVAAREGALEQTIVWSDNNDESSIRPGTDEYAEKYAPGLKFTLTELNENGEPVGSAEGPTELTESNMADVGLEAMPVPSVQEDGVGVYELGYDSLPSVITVTDIDGNSVSYQVDWELGEPVEAEGYTLVEVTKEEIESGGIASVTTPG